MKKYILITVLFFAFAAAAQTKTSTEDSLLLASGSGVSEEVEATFKSTRIVNAHSVQTVGRHSLDFRIMHRFGALNSGLYNLFGLDIASMRMGFEYGLSHRLMVGLGRSTEGKTYDGFLKYRIFIQHRGIKNATPLSVTILGSTSYKTLKYGNPRDTFWQGKVDYNLQLLAARKFNERFSLQLMPTWVHRNLVETIDQKNDIIAIGIGGRVKLNKRVAINFDYFYTSTNQLGKGYTNPLSIGIDIETGGHVFQLHFTNSRGMIEKQFIGETNGKWSKGDILFGFNLSRVF